MKRSPSSLAGVLCLLLSSALAQETAGGPQETAKQLNKLYQDHVVAFRSIFPLDASANGLRVYDDQFSNWLSEEHREVRRTQCRSDLESLRSKDSAALDPADRLNYELFEYGLKRCLDYLGFDYHLLPIDQGGFSFPATFPIYASGKGAQPFRNVSDYDKFLKRVPGFVAWMDTQSPICAQAWCADSSSPRQSWKKSCHSSRTWRWTTRGRASSISRS